MLDVLIVGGGPAGLTAAIYAARFRLAVTVIDAGGGRAAQIPLTRNHAGFPDGISGRDLLERMRAQARRYGAVVTSGRVDRLGGVVDAFVAGADGAEIAARRVLLATGVVNRRPDIPPRLHDEAVHRGLLRYCPVCDGYEVIDKAVAVVGAGERAVREATFLRAYTPHITVILQQAPHPAQRAELAALGAAVVVGPAHDFHIDEGRISVATSAGRLAFDSLYPALGSDIRSDLAAGLGAALTDDGCIKVDAHQRTSVEGLYAAGDVVIGLDQISHAMGEAGVAATTLRNDLAARRDLRA